MTDTRPPTAQRLAAAIVVMCREHPQPEKAIAHLLGPIVKGHALLGGLREGFEAALAGIDGAMENRVRMTLQTSYDTCREILAVLRPLARARRG